MINRSRWLCIGVLVVSLFSPIEVLAASNESSSEKVLDTTPPIESILPKGDSTTKIILEGVEYDYTLEDGKNYVIVTSTYAKLRKGFVTGEYSDGYPKGTLLEYEKSTKISGLTYYLIKDSWVSDLDVEKLDPSLSEVGISNLGDFTLTSFTLDNKYVQYKVTGKTNIKQDILDGYATITFYNNEKGTMEAEHIPLDKYGIANGILLGSSVPFTEQINLYHMNYSALMASNDELTRLIYDRIGHQNWVEVGGHYNPRPDEEYVYEDSKIHSSFKGAFIFDSNDVDLDNKNVSELAERITYGLTSDYDKARAIFTWIVNNVSYDYTTLENRGAAYYTSNDAYDTRLVMCTGYANLFAAMSRLVGIDTSVVTGDTYQYDGETYLGRHAWNVSKLDGEIYYIDTTWGDSPLGIDYSYFSRNLWHTHKDLTYTYQDTLIYS